MMLKYYSTNVKVLLRSKNVASDCIDTPADVLRGSSRVPAPLTQGGGTLEEAVRTFAWEASDCTRIKDIGVQF